MKTRQYPIVLAGMLLLFGFLRPAAAATYYSEAFIDGFQNGVVIPDGSLNGWSDTRTVSGAGIHHVASVEVTLSLSGGYNGDLYAYLVHGDGMTVLLNRVGMASTNAFAYPDPGFNVTLSAAGAENVHFYQAYSPTYEGDGRLTGIWRPDGRALDPLADPADFDASGIADFSAFDAVDPNGEWTLFIADVSAGGGETSILGWGLRIESVVEPATNLVITAVNNGNAVSADSSFSVVVESRDVNNEASVVVADTDLVLTLVSGDGTLEGTVTGTLANGTSSVTISGITYRRAEGGVVLRVSRTGGDLLSPGDSSSFTVEPGAFTGLQVLMPGETENPGTGSGKTGSPTDQTVGTAFNATVRAVDAYWNLISTNDTVAVTSSDNDALLPPDAPLSQGEGTFSVTFFSAGSRTITASDITQPSINAHTGAATTVNPGSQSISFSSLADRTYGPDPINLTATASSGLSVSFSLISGPATLDGSTITLTGAGSVTVQATQAGNANWDAAVPVNRTFSVAARTVIPSIVASDKVYDGEVTASLSGRNLSGVIHSDAVSLAGGTAVFADSQAGTNKTVTATGLSLTGADAGSYVLSSTSATTTADITVAEVTFVSGLIALDKVYDGTAEATLSSNTVVLAGVIAGDVADVVLSTNGYSASFDSGTIGTNRPVTVTGLGLTGSAASNYSLTPPNLTADITAAEVTVLSGLIALDKVYDGTDVATLSSNAVALGGVIAGDVASVFLSTNGYAATFDSSAVGIAKTVTVTGLSLVGGVSTNYSLTQPVLSADITPGTVARLAFITQPDGASAGVPLSQQPVVRTQDAFGNDSIVGLPVSLNVTMTLTSGSGTLVGTVVHDIGTGAGSGTATFTDLRIDTAGDKQLSANADGLTGTDSQVFNVANVAPVADLVLLSRPRNVSLKIRITDLLTNVTDANGDVLRLAGVSSSTNGAIVRTNATFILYSVPPGGNVADSFSYTVSDGTLTASGEVRITVPSGDPAGLGANLVKYGLVNGNPTITFAGVPGYNYLVQRTQDVSGTPTWTDMGNYTAPASGLFQYVDVSPPGGSVFYRAVNR